MNRVRKHVLDHEHSMSEEWNSSHEALAIKTSYASSFNMISVTVSYCLSMVSFLNDKVRLTLDCQGAITAQIAITVLSLAGVDQMHWTVTAAFLTSLIAGLLSVYYACIIQVWLAGMHSAEEVRDWFTTKRLISSGQQKWTEIPSYNAALLLVAALQLLNWSLVSLLAGVGIYYGLFFTEKLGALGGSGNIRRF